MLYGADNNGQFTHYAVCGADARMIMRVDITGKPQANQPTPHVITYSRNYDVRSGTYFVAPKNTPLNDGVRGAYPWEIP